MCKQLLRRALGMGKAQLSCDDFGIALASTLVEEARGIGFGRWFPVSLWSLKAETQFPVVETLAMKLTLRLTLLITTMFVLCVLSTTPSFAQSVTGSYVLESQPQIIHVPSHAEHASPQPMAQEQNLYVQTTSAVAHGERPLWEFEHPAETMPLGDVARLLRKQHETAKKAIKVLEK
jgi:hypothetical protein